MPFSKRLIYLSLAVLLILTTIFIYSCKDDSTVVGGDDNGGNTEQPKIGISTPKGGDTLSASGTYNITWTSNFTDEVKIEFSDDNGSSWTLVTDNTENDGIYTWSPIPDSISGQCKIRISNLSGSVSYTTDKFRIAGAGVMSLSLTKPNGGEILFTGDSYTIAWKSSNISQVKLEFSSDAGTSWNIITPNFPADSLYYIWNPIPNLKSKDCIVRISDVLTGSFADTSNSAFTIGQPKTIRVLSPNGGENWAAKSNKIINWYSSEVASVKIEYSSNNGIDWTTITNNTQSDGYFIWDPLPDFPSANAKIRITNIEDGYPSDASDSVFTISPEDALTLVAPNGGEQWQSGSSQYIRWNSIKKNKIISGGKKTSVKKNDEISKVTLQVSSVKLEYTTNSGASWTEIAADVPNNGSYTWASVPSANSSLCKVRISDMEDGTPFDLSDSTFIIYNTVQQDISVTSPNGGETWEAGTSQSITWTSFGVASVKIEYTTNNGVIWQSIVDNTPSDGFFNWTHVPNVTSTNCRVRISDAEDGFPADMSNTGFSIAPEPEITIMSPNGGESIKAGSNTNIRWTSTNISNVKIEFTTNNGADWTSIIENTPSDGLFEWTNIPDINSFLCRIKISDALDGVPFDISNDNFSIDNKVERSITVTSPNGGETIIGGTHLPISWTSLNLDTVMIDFSTNNGTDWMPIEDLLVNTGTYEWSVPDSINSNQCRIRVSNISGLPYDVSNAAFSVTPIPSLVVIYPNGGESIIAGTPFAIKWNAVGIAYVKIDYTFDDGLTYFPIIQSTPNNGKYTISLTSPRNSYKIKITNAEAVSPVDESDGTFRVLPEPSISVIAPNGDEIWPSGTSQNITWTSTGIQNVSLDYTTNNGAIWNTITTSTESDGLYSWVVPSVSSSLCKIRVKGVDDTARVDFSDRTFTISQEPLGISVTSPSINDNWEAGTSHNITWTSIGITNVKIEYSINNGVTWSTIIANTPSDGFYQWVPVPNTPSTNCKIRISDVVNNYTGQSSLFTISPEPNIQVTSPDGGEVWTVGSSQNIIWTSTNITKVKIELSTNNGGVWSTISDSTESDGIYTWNTLPDLYSLQCRIRISDANDGLPYDTSASNFAIINQAPPSITITAPIGGNKWEGGTSHIITWNSDNIANVKIGYTTNNGVNWNTIIANTPSDGFYRWDPVANTPSTNCRIRISDVVFNFTDMSELFTITPEPSIQVTAPNGGEVFQSGSNTIIKWKSTNIANIKLELTSNNGANWVLITAATPSDGSFEWQSIPDINSSLCRIRISDADDSVPFDTSDGDFSILNQPERFLSVTSPNGNESWQIGTSQNITWASTGVTNVKIEYTTNNGVDWIVISATTPSNGTYQWNPVPNTPSTNTRIRITDIVSGITDMSNTTFTIAPEPQIQVILPNGGEILQTGSAEFITWSSTNIENVKLELTTNGGATWSLIAASVPSNGAYSWNTVPNINSAQCKIKISDVTDGVPFDISDDNFIITNQPDRSLSLTSPNGGESWETGTSQNITWASTGVSNVKIEYTTNNGVNWIDIIANTASDGTYQWNPVPNTPSTNSKIRITDIISGVADMSNATFTIAPEPQILVTLPNGGERFQFGSTANITWTSTNIPNVKIEYTINGGATWNLIAASVESNGLFSWSNIPDVSSTQCKIKISDANDGVPFDISDNNFTISNQVIESIILLSPNGGEVLEAGTTLNITWNSTAVEIFKIEFSTNNGSTWSTIVNNLINSGSYEWSVPNINSTQSIIRVSDNSDGSPADESNSTFTILPIQSITLTNPNGGELISGTLIPITWVQTGIQKVKIEYSFNNGNFDVDWFTLVDSIPAATGSYSASFSLPQDIAETNFFRVRISDASDHSPIDYSDNTIKLLPPPHITVISPNGGENWLTGNTYEIRWISTSIANVHLEYTLNGGKLWIPIADVVSNGTYNWSVPANINFRSDLCRIRITDTDPTSLFTDMTDGFFSIHPNPPVEKLLRVIFPNGGERIINDAHPDTVIQWTSAGIDSVKIEYTINNGVNWILIATVPSTGAYRWALPPLTVTSTLARIRITDVNSAYTDESDSYFNLNIFLPGLIMINPGKDFKQGTENNIRWHGSDDIKQVNIEYSQDGGTTWQMIAANVVNKPRAVSQFLWKNNISGNIMLRISDAAGKYKALSKTIRVTQ